MSETKVLVPAPQEVRDLATRIIAIERFTPRIYGMADRGNEESLMQYLRKEGMFDSKGAYGGGPAVRSNQGVNLGLKFHPFDFTKVKELMYGNEYHSICINTWVSAMVGLGHVSPQEPGASEEQQASMLQDDVQQLATRGVNPQPPPPAPPPVLSDVDEALNPLCSFSWMDVLRAVGEDYVHTGNAGIEVVRAGSPSLQGTQAPITGLHHIPSQDLFMFMENYAYDMHYQIIAGEGIAAGSARNFARFGDQAGFLNRVRGGLMVLSGGPTDPNSLVNPNGTYSEVIHFRRPSSQSRWYGFPFWLAAVPSIELSQVHNQERYDYCVNRGVPEFMLFIIGQKLPEEDWKKIENSLKAHIGSGNAHKSMAINIAGGIDTIKVQMEKLAMDASKDGAEYALIREAMSLSIVSAHGVPPLLAGIQIPGKLGAVNELPNSLMGFQILRIGPEQQIFQQTLGATLGNPKLNGGLDLTFEDFAFNTITTHLDVAKMDTVSRMRQSPMQASSEGRDLKAGVKK